MAADSEYQRMGVAADAVLRLGLLMMRAGTGGYRIIRAMKRAARALGFDRVEAIITVTSISCTFHFGSRFRTVVATQDSPDVDASRIEALETLTHHLHRRIDPEWLNARLDEVERGVVKRWPTLVRVVAAGLACASFAVLNRFSIADAAVVAVAASCGQAVRAGLMRRHVRQLGAVGAAVVVACLAYWVIVQALGAVGLVAAESAAPGFVASVLFVVPGFPLFSAMIDLSRFDIPAGLSRLTYALTVIVVAAFAVMVVSAMTGMRPPPQAIPPAEPWWFALAAVASAVGVAGFALLFNSSKRMVILAAGLGAVANLPRLIVMALGMSAYVGAFVGGLTVGLLGAAASKAARVPRITVTVPAAVIMVPGPAMFASVYALNAGDMQLAVAATATATMTVLAISIGLVVARMVTDPDWMLGRYIDFDKELAGPR